jgi:alkylation response protein AidB-like acyl-CoA dehydrogenase
VQTSEQKQLVMQSTNNEAADRILSELDGLAPIIAARAAEAEKARRIPADIIEMLKSIGLFRMTAPQILGGLSAGDFGSSVPSVVSHLNVLCDAR